MNACWWACFPKLRSPSAEQDLIVQGKVERFGLRWDLRMEEKALRASTESPPRANSAMIEFHEWTLFTSMYLLNRVVMLAVVEKWRRRFREFQVNFPVHLLFIFRIGLLNLETFLWYSYKIKKL